jgi:hypothetical protein
MNRQKRGNFSLEAAIAVIIVFGIVMVISIFVYKKLLDVGREEFTEKECQASLDLTRKFDLNPVCFVEAPNPVALKCPRSFMTVTDSKVVKNGDDVTEVYDRACPTREGADMFDRQASTPQACIAENVLAKSMASCWQLFYEGQVPVFQQLEIDEFSLKSDTFEKACYVCAEIDIQTTNGAPNFRRYLQTQEYKKDLTYFEYITSNSAYCDPELRKGGLTCWEAIALNQDDSFWTQFWNKEVHKPLEDWNLPKGKYAITFVRRGMGTCEKDNVAEGEATALTFTVHAIPVEKVSQFCDMVVI